MWKVLVVNAQFRIVYLSAHRTSKAAARRLASLISGKRRKVVPPAAQFVGAEDSRGQRYSLNGLRCTPPQYLRGYMAQAVHG